VIISQIESIYSDSITLFDRGFPSYELMFLMMNQETPRHFVIRCKTSFNKEVIAFVNSNENSKIIDLKPTHLAQRQLSAYWGCIGGCACCAIMRNEKLHN